MKKLVFEFCHIPGLCYISLEELGPVEYQVHENVAYSQPFFEQEPSTIKSIILNLTWYKPKFKYHFLPSIYFLTPKITFKMLFSRSQYNLLPS